MKSKLQAIDRIVRGMIKKQWELKYVRIIETY